MKMTLHIPPTTQPHRNSMSAISQLLLTGFWWNSKGRFRQNGPFLLVKYWVGQVACFFLDWFLIKKRKIALFSIVIKPIKVIVVVVLIYPMANCFYLDFVSTFWLVCLLLVWSVKNLVSKFFLCPINIVGRKKNFGSKKFLVWKEFSIRKIFWSHQLK